MNEIEKLLVILISIVIIALAWCFPIFAIAFATIVIGYFIFKKR